MASGLFARITAKFFKQKRTVGEIQYVCDKNNRVTAVIVPIEIWEELQANRKTAHLSKSRDRENGPLSCFKRTVSLVYFLILSIILYFMTLMFNVFNGTSQQQVILKPNFLSYALFAALFFLVNSAFNFLSQIYKAPINRDNFPLWITVACLVLKSMMPIAVVAGAVFLEKEILSTTSYNTGGFITFFTTIFGFFWISRYTEKAYDIVQKIDSPCPRNTSV